MILFLLWLVVSPAVTLAQGDVAPQWFGTWQFDLAKSSYPTPPAFKRMTLRIEPSGDRVAVVYDLVRLRGGVTHLEWTGKFDGNDYAVEGVDDVVTNAYRRIDDRTYEIVQKVDGAVVLISRMAISSDGRTLTTSTANATTAFDKR